MKGRPRDPTRTRRRTGHRRKPHEAPALKIVQSPLPSAMLPPPETLPPQMVPTWNRVVEAMPTAPRTGDAFVIEAFVRQYHRMQAAGELVDPESGYGVAVRKVNGDITASPFLKAERDSAAMVLRIAEHFGLTIASRMRLGLMQLAGETLAQALSRDLEEG